MKKMFLLLALLLIIVGCGDSSDDTPWICGEWVSNKPAYPETDIIAISSDSTFIIYSSYDKTSISKEGDYQFLNSTLTLDYSDGTVETGTVTKVDNDHFYVTTEGSEKHFYRKSTVEYIDVD